MEYLTTYGWAIAIITVIIALLYSINVFNASSSLGSSCTARPGYSCTGILLSPTGQLSFTFAQDASATVYNAQFACISSSGYTTPNLAYYAAQAQGGGLTGAVSTSGPAGVQSANIPSAAGFTLNGIQCYTSTGSTSFPFGAIFTGQVWMAYNTNAIQPAPDTVFTQIAAVSVKST
jgi:hypothetical protein